MAPLPMAERVRGGQRLRAAGTAVIAAGLMVAGCREGSRGSSAPGAAASGPAGSSAREEAAVPPVAGGATPVPAVRLLDGKASETLRRTYAEAAGAPISPEDLSAESAWIDSVARPLRAFWTAHGPRILSDLADYTETPWVESSFNVYLIRRPIGVAAFSLPLVLDLSPFGRLPPGRRAFYDGLLEWALVHELVHRVQDQPWIARSTVGTEIADPRAELVAGNAHDWDDLVTAFVMRDVVGDSAVRPLLFNRALQRTVGVVRLDRFERRFLSRWRPSRERPLSWWLRRSGDLDTGVHDAEAEERLERALAGQGYVPAGRVRAAAEALRADRGLASDEIAQLLSDWEGRHGAGRLLAFPYRAPDGAWEWQESR